MASTSDQKKTSEPKVRFSKCEMCTTRTDMRLLYVVLDKKMCMPCGQKQIDIWNAAVKDYERQTFKEAK